MEDQYVCDEDGYTDSTVVEDVVSYVETSQYDPGQVQIAVERGATLTGAATVSIQVAPRAPHWPDYGEPVDEWRRELRYASETERDAVYQDVVASMEDAFPATRLFVDSQPGDA